MGYAEIIGIIITVAMAAASAYANNAAQQSQADAQRRAYQMQAEAEKAAGDARRSQVLWDAERKKQSQKSRQASAGVQVGQGSLLEGEMEFASSAEYAAQLAQYPHQIANQQADYGAKLFKAQKGRLQSAMGFQIGAAAGSTLASGFGRQAGSSPSATASGNLGFDSYALGNG